MFNMTIKGEFDKPRTGNGHSPIFSMPSTLETICPRKGHGISCVERMFSLLILLLLSCQVFPAVYRLNDQNDSVVGEIRITTSIHEDTLPDIARNNGLGYEEIKLVNPEMDTWLPGEGSKITLPVEFVLPQSSRKGLVLNIPEMRLYYFPGTGKENSMEVITYPLGVGREGWNTPYTSTTITGKIKDPSWYPPESIRKEHEEMGEPLPKIVKPGPENPLGNFAMRLGIPSYLIHGTNKPYGVGMRVSHGCIRLYPEDIKELFEKISIGTPVTIVNQPYKVGSRNGRIFLEAHPYLEEDAGQFEGNLTTVVRMLVNITSERQYAVDWNLAKQVINEHKGIPVAIGRFISTPEIITSNNQDMAGENAPAVQGLELRLDTDLHSLEQEMF